MSSNEPTTVLLESSDGFQFIIRRSAAIKSSAIKGMLNKRSKYFSDTTQVHTHIRRKLIRRWGKQTGNFTEAVENRIVFKNMT